MKRVNVAKLKAHLSEYLRMAQKGEQVVVLDRDKPIASITGMPTSTESVWQRLAREGRCKVGTQDWTGFEVPKLKKSVPIEDLLREVGRDFT
jgi:antitoxin (DNA-binding transcriptional repressor) of toxin-antitoxin stability system